MFASFSIVNLGNYFYHLLMGRMLGPADYGVLSSLISLVYFFGVPVGAVGLSVVKYVSVLKSDKNELASFYFWLMKKALVVALAVFAFLLLLSPLFASLIKLDSPLLVIVVLSASLMGAFVAFNLSFFQGLLKFFQHAVINSVLIIAKLSSRSNDPSNSV